MRKLIAILFSCFWTTAIYALELRQATAIARDSTLFLLVDYVDCTAGVARKAMASGFLVTEAGSVVTAAHTFYSPKKSCQHKVRGIRGTQIRETGPTVDQSKSLDLEFTGRIDHQTDMAILRIKGEIPASMRAHWICQEKLPQAAEQLFAFGYPEGRPFTPLPLIFSRNDVQSGFWIVSGLTTGGMSGGPVLDSKGNAVGLIQGGLLNDEGHVSAVRYVAPLQGLSRLILKEERLFTNCGEHQFERMRTVDDGPGGISVISQDALSCNLGVPPGFRLGRVYELPDTVALKPNPAMLDKMNLRALDAARFFVMFTNLTIEQYGLNHKKFEPDRGVLACAAAVTRGSTVKEFKDHFLKFAKWTEALGNGDPAQSVEDCLKKSKWPTLLTTSNAEFSRDISFPIELNPGVPDKSTMNRVIQVPLRFHRRGGVYGGSMVYFDVPLALGQFKSAAEKGELPTKDGLEHMYDSATVMQLKGFSARCVAYDNISFSAFQNACHSVLGRAVFRAGDKGATCVAPRRH